MYKKILSDDARERLVAAYEVPDITLQELIEEISLPVKKSALCDAILYELKLTRMMIHAAEKKRPDVVQKRKEWIKFLEETDATSLVFLDESGIGLTRNYARSCSYDDLSGNYGGCYERRAFQRICGENFVSVFEVRRHRCYGQSFGS